MNYWAILVAALLQYGLGALWYSPLLFGKQWMRLMKINPAERASKKKEAARGYALMLVTALVMSFVLARFVTGASTWIEGALTGLWVWLGFIATVTLGGFLWEGKPFSLYLLNAGYWLVTLLLTGSLLAAWK
ncbi:DUF1761 domain-containing protein [Candidatus Woesearchaeota archaeon]|nr:DUF1761 domain-containing protein [Candidatus Woesearchaeota archaeon]